MSITVKKGEVFVRAPLFSSNKQIDKFVNSKATWINKQVAKQNQELNRKESFKLDGDSKILVLGEEMPVSQVLSERTNVESLTSDELIKKVKHFYKKKAKRVITAKVTEFSQLMDISVNNVRITSAKTRWGSCSSKGNVNFSWYLIMAPEEQVDYVIIHELAHIKQMNHSKRFWNIVEKYLPDYKIRRKKLKELQSRLNSENWG